MTSLPLSIADMSDTTATLKRTPFFDIHQKLGAKIVPFAGYEMPV